MNQKSVTQQGSTYSGNVSVGDHSNLCQGNIIHVHQTAADTRLKDLKVTDTCLKDLKVTDPRQDKERIIESIDGGLERATYSWVFNEHGEYNQWRNNPENQLLWLKGHPGKGKTILMCGIIKELEASAANTGLLSYFFCQNQDGRLNTATNVLRGLIYMLAGHETLVHHVKKPYDKDGKELFEGVNAWFDLRDIFIAMVNDTHFTQAIVMVDGLDECVDADDRERLVNLINQTMPSRRIKWILSSRDLPEIEELLVDDPHTIPLSLEDNSDSVSSSVHLYIRNKVDGLSKTKKYDQNLRTAVEDRLLSRAEGTFLWVALVCKQLRRVTRMSTLATLDRFPKGLWPFYERMLEMIIDDADDERLCKQILAIATVAFRPLKLEELWLFLEDRTLFDAPRMARDDRKDIEDVILRCGSFIALQDGILSLIHQSAKDFLLTRGSDQIFFLGQKGQHHAMYSRSIAILSQSLRRDIYDLKSSAIEVSQFKVPDPDPLAGLRYACVYWTDHFCEGYSLSLDSPDGHTAMTTFMEAKFTHWLEALSFLGGLRGIQRSFLRLRTLVETKAGPQLSKLLYDANRFIESHVEVIERHPLQAYISALVFTPSKSIIRCRYHDQIRDYVELRGCVEKEWGACLQTLEGHPGEVGCVAVDPGGKYIASASSFHNPRNTVKIWDVTTGLCLHTLHPSGGWVNSITFVPETNGKNILSASNDCTIKVWEMVTEEYVCTSILSGHTGGVYSVACALSDTGVKIGSSSEDDTIRIWDLTTSRCVQVLNGHTGAVLSVVFIPESDGREIVSASTDRTVKIWNTVSGHCLRTLIGHTARVNSIAFMPGSGVGDGGTVASASNDRLVKLWDRTTGKCLQTLKGHSDSVKSVSFRSSDGKLASASDDETVRIWDMKSGECLQTLTDHTGEVSSVVFSHDGRKVISASSDWTLRVWDVETGRCPKPHEGHTNGVPEIAFSPNGQRAASVSLDNVMKIWDVRSGRCLKTVKLSTISTMPAIAYSPNGRYVVSSGYHVTVKVWDAETGQHLKTISEETRTIQFDHHGRYLSRTGPVNLTDADPESGRIGGTYLAAIPLPSRLSMKLDLDILEWLSDVESAESRWITWEGKKLLRLPQNFRPQSFDTYESQIAIGCFSGDVLFLKVSAEGLKQLGY